MTREQETADLRAKERARIEKKGVSPHLLKQFDKRTLVLIAAARRQDNLAIEGAPL